MYYIIYGSLFLISLLPFFILYGISDFAYFIMYRIIGYRKEVVLFNLSIAFPEKTEKERLRIASRFYRNLTDTFIETIKFLSISKKAFNKRVEFDLQESNALAAKGLNIQLMAGHQMNWEYANWYTAMNLDIPFVGIYMKIKNKSLDKLFYSMRGKYGTVLVAATEFKTKMHQVFHQQYSIGLAADQNPGGPDNVYWLNYFNKPVPFVTGPDKGARKSNAAVVFVKMMKPRRGYYKFVPTVITENAGTFKEGELTLIYRDFLEKVIRESPDNYLWSHRRWKWEYKPEYEKRWIDYNPPHIK